MILFLRFRIKYQAKNVFPKKMLKAQSASGSDKQMLCASSGARAALNIAAEKVNKRGRSVTRRKNLFLWGSFSQKGELHAVHMS